MKLSFNLFTFLIAAIISLVTAQGASAQSFRTACPYNVASWPYPNNSDWMGCPPGRYTNPSGPACPIGYAYKPFQDCCGAIQLCTNRITLSVQNPNPLFNSQICGQGCSQFDLPPVGTTCFGVNERGTYWVVFEVKPLAGGPDTIGAPAGKLRFKFFSCELPPNSAVCGEATNPACNCDIIDITSPTYCNDNGTSNLGNIDYDWILFKAKSRNSLRSSCDSIRTRNTSRVCCNWSATKGPTGLFELPNGTTPSCDNGALGGRYGAPFNVFVGDVFILAVDIYTYGSSGKGFMLDFSGTCANVTRDGVTANVGRYDYPGERIPTSQFQQLLSRTDSCSLDSMSFRFTQPQRNATMSVNNYKLFSFNANGSIDSNLVISEVLPINDPITATDWIVNFDTLGLPRGNYALRFSDTVATYCENKIVSDTLFFTVGGGLPPTIKIVQPFDSCLLQPTTLTVSDTAGYTFLWSTGETTSSIVVREPNQYSVTATFNGACRQTTTANFVLQQPSLRNCPISITQNTRLDSLTASLLAFRYQWERNNGILSNVTRRIPITANGSYRVRAINSSDTGIWSAPFVVTNNKISLKSNGLEVFPNPSKGIVNIQVPTGFQTIELSDKLGKVLLTKPIQNTTTINVQGYPKGVYTIRAKGGERVLSTQLIVE